MTANFLIVSGTSGSGKTIALQVLEDLGFYAIDNLPASLLPDLAARSASQPTSDDAINRFAVSIDSRNHDIDRDLQTVFSQLDKLNVEHRIVFLDADDNVLLKRYSETRRKHPLSNKRTSLSEAIARERELLEQLADGADYRINTSKTTPHELRSQVRNYAAATEHSGMTLLFQSFGFKYGNPRDADFVFDVRCLPNPHWNPELKPLTGLDDEVANFLAEDQQSEDMYAHIRDFIETWLPHFIQDNRNYMTVAIGCTGGQHRSVYLSQRLHAHFVNNPTMSTLVRHRELHG